MSNDSGFDELGISRKLQEKLIGMNIISPTEVQQRTIPTVLAGRNLIVQSPTGTGKTLAYLTPLLMRTDPDSKDLEVLILVPSRELAVQVVKVAKALAEDGNKVALLVGGASQDRQLETLKGKPKLAVGTPGRVSELLKKRKINGQAVRAIVVDEADKMFSQGFMNDVKAIFKATLKSRQALFFSATIPREMNDDIPEMAQAPDHILLKETGRVPDSIEHLYIMCEKQQRTQILIRLLNYYKPGKAIVFIQRNEGVGPLAGRLKEMGFNAAALHSELPRLLRKEMLEKFRKGRYSIMVTTDLLARGMDIEGIEYIFNYDLPRDEEFYLHRVGRTGRGGRTGTAVTLVDEDQKFIIGKYTRYLRVNFIQVGLDEEDRVFTVKYNTTKRKGR